ncbi:sugar ABC transporter permease [Amycolatopsis cihanbeyliensis]|uniref:Unsaturated chondroitin disaccharide hydrolase n=1 Tax=Amycolatopsis cihanbeyliensis TaxID=1128664 RepID=A0A542DEB9_AMYCI|nr:sugar ABC transporter permease [Amycolatopsis cihanbeyliensis]TQJ01413.1 unsaturated chondroitin disaccharide hydrolase [Amycolatopsis cihanbeyliensis]
MTRWRADALARALERVASTEAEVGMRFPLHADPRDGTWVTTRRGSWTGGFWAGQLWLRARLTGVAEHARAAADCAARLAPWAEADTATRGLILWYGVAAGGRLGVSTAADEPARAGAEQLRRTFDPAVGTLPWGTAFGDPAEPVIARVDGVAGTVPLLCWAGEAGAVAARRHLRTHLELCVTPAGSRPAWQREAGGWAPRAQPPAGWSRGEAWLLLALADAAHWLDPGFGRHGRELAARWAGGVPPAVRERPDSPPDTSAAAITVVALAKLGQRAAATALLKELVDGHRTGAGGLGDGCHDLARGLATRHELVWGDYFLLLALAILTGAVPAHAL